MAHLLSGQRKGHHLNRAREVWKDSAHHSNIFTFFLSSSNSSAMVKTFKPTWEISTQFWDLSQEWDSLVRFDRGMNFIYGSRARGLLSGEIVKAIFQVKNISTSVDLISHRLRQWWCSRIVGWAWVDIFGYDLSFMCGYSWSGGRSLPCMFTRNRVEGVFLVWVLGTG